MAVRQFILVAILTNALQAAVLKNSNLFLTPFSSSHSSNITGNFCGGSYSKALECHTSCPSGTNRECGKGQECFANITCSSLPTNYCGLSLEDAQETCSEACPGGLDEECSSKRRCYVGISCNTDPPTTEYPTTTVNKDGSDGDGESPSPTPVSGESPPPSSVGDESPPPPAGSGESPTPVSQMLYYCGTSEADAMKRCHEPCPSKLDSDCSSKLRCYAVTSCSS